MSSQTALLELLVTLVTVTLMLLSGLDKHLLERRPQSHERRRSLLRLPRPKSPRKGGSR